MGEPNLLTVYVSQCIYQESTEFFNAVILLRYWKFTLWARSRSGFGYRKW